MQRNGALLKTSFTMSVTTTTKTWDQAYNDYENLHPNGHVGYAYEQPGDKWPLATVALHNATPEEAAICAEALAHGVNWEAWPVHFTQLSHWGGGPRKSPTSNYTGN
jgi:hypothetical protein